MEFLLEVQAYLVSTSNQDGDITSSGCECAGILENQLALEGIAPTLVHKHAGSCRDNTPTVAWAAKMASKRLVIAGRLL